MQERVDKRTLNSKTYEIEADKFRTVIHSAPIHYEDEYGNLHDSSTELFDESNFDTISFQVSADSAPIFNKFSGGGNVEILHPNNANYRALKLPFDAQLPKVFTRGYLIGKGKDCIKFIPVGANSVKAVKDGSKLHYPSAWTDTDVTLELTHKGVKETITLLSNNAPSVFLFEAEGLESTALKLQSPWLEDANGEHRDVTQRIYQDGGKTIVELTADLIDLTFPVVIDPTVTLQPDETASKDTYVYSLEPKTNYGDVAGLHYGRNSSGDKYRTFIWFDLSTIPQNASISSAIFSVYVYSGAVGVNFDIYSVTEAWDEHTITWNLQPSFDSSSVGRKSISSSPSWCDYDLSSFVQNIVNGIITNQGWVVKHSTELTEGYHSCHSSNYLNKPKLTIEYTTPASGGSEAVVNISTETGFKKIISGGSESTVGVTAEGSGFGVTDMPRVTMSQLEHLRHGGAIGVTITADLLEGEPITLTNEDIREGSFNIDRNWVSGSNIEIGNAETSELTFELDNGTGKWDNVRLEGARLTVVFDIDGEPLRGGTFTVDEPPRKLSTMQIRALDDMARFNRPYVTDLVYPATLQQILVDACAKCNVFLYTQSFDNNNYIVDEKPDGEDITFHNIVAWVAELSGNNAWMDELARLQLSWYGEGQISGLKIGPEDRHKYELAESDITITGIIYRTSDTDYIAGTDGYPLIIEDNPLMQKNIEAILTVLNTKLQGFVYRPYDFSTLGYPNLWPGDAITKLTDANGNIITSIITSHQYTLNGNSHLQAKGQTASMKGYATGAPFTASQKRILSAIAQVEVERQASAIELATLHLNHLMVNSLGYYDTTIEEGGAKKTYIHDKPLLAESQIIYTLTEQGFAWTDQGWQDGNPVWQYGATSDGSLVMKLISVVGLNADWIIAGSISADRIIGGTISGVTIDIGNGNFTVDSTGWIKGAKGGFSVPPTADGVFNDYGGAARWKFTNSAYIYQDSSEFRVYLGGAQKFNVLSDGSAYVVEGGSYEQIATRSWVQNNNVARFG